MNSGAHGKPDGSGSRPGVGAATYSQPDSLHKQQMYTNYASNYHPFYTPSQLKPGISISSSNKRVPYPYTFIGGPGTPSGQAVAHGISAEHSAMIKHSSNPYARPISAEDLLGPEGVLSTKSPLVSYQLSGSNSSLSSLGSMSSGMIKPVAQQQSANTNVHLQTNSFMRPQNAPQVDHKGGVVPTSVDQQNHKSALALHPHVTRPPSGHKKGTVNPRPGSAIKKAGTKVEKDVASASSATKATETKPKQPYRYTKDDHSIVNRASDTSSGRNIPRTDLESSKPKENGSSAKPPVGPNSVKQEVNQAQTTPSTGAKYGRNGVQTWVMNKTGSSTFKSVQVNGTNGQAVNVKSASGQTLTNQFVPRLINSPRSSISSSQSDGSSAGKVRNPNYTPSKPYSQVRNTSCSDVPDDGSSVDQSDSERRTEALNSKMSGGSSAAAAAAANKKNVSFSSHAMAINPQMLLDGRIKEMPVTHTLTGWCRSNTLVDVCGSLYMCRSSLSSQN